MSIFTHSVENFRLLIDESIKIRNWRRGEKYCSLLKLTRPLDTNDILNWCKCLYHLSDYFAVLRITQPIFMNNKSEFCIFSLQLLLLRSESEFSIGKYKDSIDTSNIITKNATKAIESISNSKDLFFLKQIKIRALLIQARIYELNSINQKFIEINKSILLDEDPLNVSAIKSIFCSQRLIIEDKLNLLEEWKKHIPGRFKWLFYIVLFRVLRDQFIGLDIDFTKTTKFTDFSSRDIGKVPFYASKMSFVRDQLFHVLSLDNKDSLLNKSNIFDPSNSLDREREILMRTTSSRNDIGLVLTATNILDEKIPLSPLSLFSMGCYYYKQSMYSKSAHLFRRVIELEPGFYEAHLLLAHSFSLNNNHSQALMMYSFIQDQWKGSYYGSLYKGVEYLRSGEYEMAKLNIERSLNQNPKNPISLNEYGVLLFYRKKYKEAIVTFRRALDSDILKESGNKDLLYLIRVNLSCSLMWSFLYCDEEQDVLYIDEIIILLQGKASNKTTKLGDSLIKIVLAIAYQIIGDKEKATEKYLECISKNSTSLNLPYLMCI